MGLEHKLLAELESAKNEREIQPFLKGNPILVRNVLNVCSWNYVDLLPEFKLKTNFRVDFLVLSADSGQWHATIVEAKSHRAKVFTKAGHPSQELNKALRQLDEREDWLRRHEALFREALSKHLDKHHVCTQTIYSTVRGHTWGKTEITDPRTVLHCAYKVLIGRRASFSEEYPDLRGHYYDKGREILTYDRLVDKAREFDAYDVLRAGGGKI